MSVGQDIVQALDELTGLTEWPMLDALSCALPCILCEEKKGVEYRKN